MRQSGATIRPDAPEAESPRRRLRPIARWLVALVVASAVAMAAGSALGPERFWLLEQVQYLPFPFLLVPAIAAVAASFSLGRAWRMASVLGLGLVVTVVMGFEFHFGDAGSGRIRVMTYNVKGYLAKRQSTGFALIAQEIALHNPDILVLQDASDIAALEEKSPGAARAIFGELRAYFHDEYVVASRYPLRECASRQVPARKRPHSQVRCIVDAPGVELAVMTAHFLTPRSALNAAREVELQALDEWQQNLSERTLQAGALADEVRASRRPVILAGDFNAPESSLVVRTLLAAGLRNCFSTAGKGYGYTWGHSLQPGVSFLRIDHILVSTEIGVGDCFVGSKQASPHRPVIADLYLNRQPG